MALLVIEDVAAGYGSGPDILTGLSLAIEPDRSYCIIGPNGAGKSTLLKVIAGLLSPRRGRVLFKNAPIMGLRPDEVLRRGVCFVPQDRSLFPDMTVAENLRMGGYILKDKRLVAERIEQVYALFPVLRERSAQSAKTLSGGQQQMALIGRAMVTGPEVIMLDEPSLGLAPKIARQIFDNIGRLRDAGMTVILVEQNARMGLAFADQGCVLDLGRLHFEGPSATVLADPRIQELYLGRRGAASAGTAP